MFSSKLSLGSDLTRPAAQSSIRTEKWAFSDPLSAEAMLTDRYGNWNAKTVMALMEVGSPAAMLGR